MTSGDRLSVDSPGTGGAGTGNRAWGDLEVWERLAIWEEKSPGTAGELIKILKADRRHAQRLAWADWARQMTGVVLGFGCVIVITMLAWHYADIGSPFNGTLVMGAGTGSIVAIFVTGRYVGRTQRYGVGQRGGAPGRRPAGADGAATGPAQRGSGASHRRP